MLLKLMLTPKGLAFDRFLVKWTGHSFLNRLFAQNAGFEPRPALLLVTRGARSGQDRAVALPYFRLEGKLIVVGSRGGMPEDPYWAKNLRQTPQAWVHIDRRKQPVRARIAQAEERSLLWPQLVALVPTYRDYQSMTSREIPVVVLEPRTV